MPQVSSSFLACVTAVMSLGLTASPRLLRAKSTAMVAKHRNVSVGNMFAAAMRALKATLIAGPHAIYLASVRSPLMNTIRPLSTPHTHGRKHLKISSAPARQLPTESGRTQGRTSHLSTCSPDDTSNYRSRAVGEALIRVYPGIFTIASHTCMSALSC